MAVMSQLFVAREADAQKFAPASAGPLERVELGGLTSLEFETLWAILEGEEWSPEKHELQEIIGDDEESWVHQFPPTYVERLTALAPGQVQSAAEAWAQTEEISGAAADVAPAIESLVKLARSAKAKKLGLFVWTSL
jgi:hypothetical protein